MKRITDEYIGIWIDQAERQKKYNPGDGAVVSLDDWLAILCELRTLRKNPK